MDETGPASTSEYKNKFIVPDSDEPRVEEIDRRRDGTGGAQMKLNVDPDFVDHDDSEAFEGDCFEDGTRPAPVSRAFVDGAKERRSREKERAVKMSIGNCDEMEDEETEVDEQRQFAEGLRNIHRHKSKQESFDFEDGPDNNAMRDFINKQVNNAMMFNTDNPTFQHIEFEPVSKRKGPKIIEGYLWGAVIGVGSYGKVKEVIDTFTLTRRAAKIMKYDRLRKITNGWDNIRSEMAILKRLEHPNVIKLIEVFNIPSKGKVYMIFEYCIGSVQQLLDLEPARRLTIGESHAVFIQMCKGLNYLHSKRISHKDIKPGNLLVAIDFGIKICDFGVAEQIDLFQSDGKCTKVNGTPKFQPPECVYGNHEFFDGYKADMWSAGVTLYNLVSGKYPFEKPVLLKLYECIGTAPLVMPTNVSISRELNDLLHKLIEKDFTQRIGCLEVMQHSWFISSFPEDQGLGRIMERMRTGDRPLTMLPSMAALYDDLDDEYELDDEGNAVFLPLKLTDGGEIDHQTFRGFKYLEVSSGDGIQDEDSSLDPVRRPSSRSMPTSAPIPHAGSSSSASGAMPSSSSNGPTPEQTPQKRRRNRRNLFSCIFRNRTDSL